MLPFMAFDLETFRFGPAQMAPRPISLGWATEDGRTELLHLNPALPAVYPSRSRVRNHLEQAAAGRIVLVGQNVGYDLRCLAAWQPDLTSLIFRALDADGITDTEIRQKLLDIHAGCYRGWDNAATGKRIKIVYHLAALAERHLGAHLEKGGDTWRTRYGELWKVPVAQWPPEAVEYAELDPRATLGVCVSQKAEAAALPGVLDDQWRQTRAAFALHLASTWGIRTDVEGVAALRQRTQDTADGLAEVLRKVEILRPNGSRNMKRVQELICALPAPLVAAWPRTPKGALKADAETLRASEDETLSAVADYNAAKSMLTGGVKQMEEGVELPLHTYFNSLMETGRTSSSGPNIQNVRREPGARECFVPRPGCLYAACDFDKAELHTLAEVCYQVLGRSTLGDMLNRGFDPHLELGRKAFLERKHPGITYEDCLASRKDPEVKEARQRAKPANFGFPGGMGPRGFQSYAFDMYGLRFSIDESTDLRDGWLETWPEMDAYFDWARGLLAQAGVYTIRQLSSGRMRGQCSYTVLCNTMFQGLCADGAKAAMYAVAREEYADPGSPLYGCRTVNFIHDELLVEVPDDLELADAAARRLQEVMVKAFNPWVPHVPVRAGVALMRRWSKAAEPAYDGDLLVPWEERA